MSIGNNATETIAVTVYSIVSSTVLVEIDANLTFSDKKKVIEDIAMDVYAVDSDDEGVYEEIHDVKFAECNHMSEFAEFMAVQNQLGDYELVEKY